MMINMKYNLPDRILRELSFFAKKYSVTKIILFGSRARGTNTERSDIDIAVYGGDFEHFYWDVKENMHSLLMFDVVRADVKISDELKQEIERDGVKTLQIVCLYWQRRILNLQKKMIYIEQGLLDNLI